MITVHTYGPAQLLGSAAMTSFCVLLFWGATFKKRKMKDATNYRPLISVPGKWQRCTCKYLENSRITLKHQQGAVKKKTSPLFHFNWVNSLNRLWECCRHVLASATYLTEYSMTPKGDWMARQWSGYMADLKIIIEEY